MGGAPRDAALGRRLADLDLACAGDAEGLARAVARGTGGTLVVLDDATRIYRIALPEGQIDVAALQGADIAEDLARRDFTVNAIAVPVEGGAGGARLGAPVDPRGGFADLRKRTLRASGPEAFRDDPVRLLRAFRIAAQLGLRIEPRTLRAIRREARRIRGAAGERVRQELLSLLSLDGAHAWLRQMDETRLLTAVLPGLADARACARRYYGTGGVMRHTLDVAERMDTLLGGLGKALPGLEKQIEEHLDAWGGEGAHALLRLASLLHDIAKPATARMIGGRLRFFGHDERGARMAGRELARLRFSRRETDAVCACVRHHLRPGSLASGATISPRSIYRFFRDLGAHGVPLLLLCWADYASYASPARLKRALPTLSKEPGPPGPERQKTARHLRIVTLLLRAYFTRAEVARPVSLLNGHDVMRELGIPPGPAVGRILGRLAEAQAAGRVKDRDGALRFVRRFQK